MFYNQCNIQNLDITLNAGLLNTCTDTVTNMHNYESYNIILLIHKSDFSQYRAAYKEVMFFLLNVYINIERKL